MTYEWRRNATNPRENPRNGVNHLRRSEGSSEFARLALTGWSSIASQNPGMSRIYLPP